MEKRRLVAAIAIVIMLSGCSGKNENDITKGITMKEAWEMADVYAKQWKEDAKVLSIVSSDYEGANAEENGIEGARECWLFSYKSNLTLKQYSFYLYNGEAKEARESAFGYYCPIQMDKISMDTTDAYKMALEDKISGGTDWAWGYHYALQYCQDAQTQEIQLLLSVRGKDGDGRDVILNIDPYTGERVEMLTKTILEPNGEDAWESQTFKQKNADADESIDEDRKLSREQIQQKYDLVGEAKKYHMLPEELTDNYLLGIQGSRFAPYSDTMHYQQNEWERLMKELYGADD